MSDYGLTELESKIIQEQIKRRQEMRNEFLKQRTNPYKHAAEAGYVFDSGIQRFISMKTCQYELFDATPRTIRFGLLTIVGPMFAFGYLVWDFRSKREEDIRSGKLRYRDRIHKLL